MIEHELGDGTESDNEEADVDAEIISSEDEETVTSEDRLERPLK